MPDSAATTIRDMMASANAAVPRLTVDEVRQHLAAGALLLDVRDPNEVAASGKLAGAATVSRGMLEFRADPDSPAHLPSLRRDQTILVYCASGGRAALSGATLRQLGFGRVFNAGGFKDLAAGGLPLEPG
jgi:rhodanese-related sulfurtransferase